MKQIKSSQTQGGTTETRLNVDIIPMMNKIQKQCWVIYFKEHHWCFKKVPVTHLVKKQYHHFGQDTKMNRKTHEKKLQ